MENITFVDFNLILNRVKKSFDEHKFPNIGYAFEYVVLEELYPDLDDVSEYITDGPNDHGIDAVVFQEDNVIDLFQFKFTEKFENHKSDGLKDGPINAIESALRRITAYDQDFVDSCNPLLQTAVKEMWNCMGRGEVKITVHFYTNLAEPVSSTKLRSINIVLGEFGAKSQVYGIADLMSLVLKNKTKPFNTKFQLAAKSWFENVISGSKYVVGSIDAYSLMEAISEDGKLVEDIFDENVRMYLRRKGKINKSIYGTAVSEENYNFFFFNNGITMLCDEMDYSKSVAPSINAYNMRIVNGSQTIHALYDVYQNPLHADRLKEINLLLRIYEVRNKELGQKIAEFTNSQNPVKSRDLRSNDQTQAKLEEILKDAGYYYARKKNQFSNLNLGKDKIIDSEKLGQILLAYYLEKPGAAKNKKREVYGSYFSAIFDPEKISLDYVLTPFQIFQKIDSEIAELRKEKLRLSVSPKEGKEFEEFVKSNDYLFHATYYWLTAVKLLAARKGINLTISSLPDLVNLLSPAKKILLELVNSNESQAAAQIFKSDSAVEELKRIIDK